MAEHCLQYSAQRVSVEVATCCSIRYIEDWKKDATLPAILRTTCFSGGGYTLHHYEQRGAKTWFQHRLQYCAQLVSVEVATCCNITCNEDWKRGF